MNASYVHSYLKDGSVFVLANEWAKPLPDELYIEGAIDLVINGTRLLGFEDWDLVDQLWAYLLDGLFSVFQSGKPFEIFFPDQPLKLQLSRATEHRINFSVGNHSANVSATSLLFVLAQGGQDFIKEIRRLAPSSSASWNPYVDKCAGLLEIAYAMDSR